MTRDHFLTISSYKLIIKRNFLFSNISQGLGSPVLNSIWLKTEFDQAHHFCIPLCLHLSVKILPAWPSGYLGVLATVSNYLKNMYISRRVSHREEAVSLLTGALPLPTVWENSFFRERQLSSVKQCPNFSNFSIAEHGLSPVFAYGNNHCVDFPQYCQH